jgi:hypothetical protein
VQSKGKRILLCGDWKINYLQFSVKLSELQNLLFMHILANMVKSPTRIMHNTSSLIDIMINNLNFEKQTLSCDLGYSDHLAEVVYIKVAKPVLGSTAIKKRQFTDKTIEEFVCLLLEESWDEIFLLNDVNISFKVFMNTFVYYLKTVFPIKISRVNNNNKNKELYKSVIEIFALQ